MGSLIGGAGTGSDIPCLFLDDGSGRGADGSVGPTSFKLDLSPVKARVSSTLARSLLLCS
jgi:hypothetical protein